MLLESFEWWGWKGHLFQKSPPCRGWRMSPRFFWNILCEAALCGDHMAQAVAWWYMAVGAPAGSGWETTSRLSALKREAWSWISARGVNTGSRARLVFELHGHTSTVSDIQSGDSNYCIILPCIWLMWLPFNWWTRDVIIDIAFTFWYRLTPLNFLDLYPQPFAKMAGTLIASVLFKSF